MERLGTTLLVAGVLTFFLGFFLQGWMPVLTLRNVPSLSMAELAAVPTPEFEQLAEDYPGEFKTAFGEVSPRGFERALRTGRDLYIAEACWHCHSQQVRPVSNEDVRFGPVSNAEEYQNELNLPHLFGTRRVGPDLIREAGLRSNDWHMAHLYDPRSTSPWSVMPAYTWYFDDERRPREGALALVAYMQWLGSWTRDGLAAPGVLASPAAPAVAP